LDRNSCNHVDDDHFFPYLLLLCISVTDDAHDGRLALTDVVEQWAMGGTCKLA
jgi:hypothetical protein